MSQEEKEKPKILAELKEYLERRISDLEKELELLRLMVEVVDEKLVEKSFKKPSLTPEVKEVVKEPLMKGEPQASMTSELEEGKIRILKAKTGEVLARVIISPNELRFIIDPEVKVTVDTKPFSSFLVKKVLEAMSRMDGERVKKGALPPGQELSYNIIQDGDRVKEIVVRNFREEYRIREIVNAIRWTLETIFEKQSTHQ
ncbi:MAG: hypothetical protein NZ929_03700 [Aigarchaeota archaeon]|nr:hypothetical protein [Aigarchaeota archaeon]MCX8192814.1 hypothetical protein [Nitrososphaeria archaeon]MDW7986058.1 hypothetical protein [Nitrososphaerota archaeon]